MSLRSRLLVVLFLAGVVLTAAIGAIVHLVSTSDATRIEAAGSHGGATAELLAEAYEDRGDASTSMASPSDALRRWMAKTIAILTRPLGKTAEGGFCTPDGAVVMGTRAAVRDPKKALIAMEHRALVSKACSARATLSPEHVAKRQETVIVSYSPIGAEGGAFTVVSLRTAAEPNLWQIEIGLLGIGTLAIVVVALDALFALRRGAAQLEDDLVRLGKDLRAPVTKPRAEELASIAEGLQAMAGNLAEAVAREHALAKQLGHEQRLAGLGRVVAGVAHEIRNPLAGMKLRLDLLARSPAIEGEVRDDVRACIDEVGRLDRVVRSLLVVARRDPPRKTVLSLGPLADERIALAEERAKARQITLSRRGDAEVTSDPDALARVVDNLVRNAIDASPDLGKVEVVISPPPASAEASTPSRGGTLQVFDEGAGIPDDRAGEVFEPFFTTKSEGTGLGLWLSRSLVQALGGSLDYSRVDGRTRFAVSLPG